MNKQESDILKILLTEDYINQRILAENSGYSLGTVNKILKELVKSEYISEDLVPTVRAIDEYNKKVPKRAIILAAGFGMRMVPINTEIPKGLLEVNSEPLIERIIKQLHEVGVKKVYVVVGYLKERYEYLIDEFGVELVVNREYTTKNNLHSLEIVSNILGDSYIVPCDVWCEKNPFNKHEMYSWYMVNDKYSPNSNIRVNRKNELIKTTKNDGGVSLLGICYLDKSDAEKVVLNLKKLKGINSYDDLHWEESLYEKGRMIVTAKIVSSEDVIGINTYEQLRELDKDSNHLKTDAIQIICKVLNVKSEEIRDITVFKKGMTNRTFLFTCSNKKYIMRIPGEGTDQLINRKQEAMVYNAIKNHNISDDIFYINPDNGYKITEFLEDARVCDPKNFEDVKKCLNCLKAFHRLELKVNHEFDIFKQLDFYESLWDGTPSVYKDYKKTKENVYSLKKYIEPYVNKRILTHIDSVADNFLFTKNGCGEDVRIIDWEYAAMQDPHLDVAMFCIYSLYSKKEVDRIIDCYFEGNCSKETRIKIYCYIAVCGLLWSNWCEYKRNLGVEFGEYSLRQYRYAKDYYRIVQEELDNESR